MDGWVSPEILIVVLSETYKRPGGWPVVLLSGRFGVYGFGLVDGGVQ